MRIPDYQNTIAFQKALFSAMSDYAKSKNIVGWPPKNISTAGINSSEMARKFFGKDHVSAQYKAITKFVEKHHSNQLASSSFCTTCWNKLLSEHREGLKQACIDNAIKMILYPPVSEALAFYSFYQCPPHRRTDKAKALVGLHVGYRPYWLKVDGMKTPIIRYTLKIDQHRDDASVLVAKETVVYHEESASKEVLKETSYGIVVPDAEYLHVYLIAAEQRRHKHYVLTQFSTRLDSATKIERMNGAVFVASSRGNLTDNVYLSGRGTVLQYLNNANKEDYLPEIMDLDDNRIDVQLRKALLFYEGGYITNWDDKIKNSVQRAVASELVQKATQLESAAEELKKMAERVSKY